MIEQHTSLPPPYIKPSSATFFQLVRNVKVESDNQVTHKEKVWVIPSNAGLSLSSKIEKSGEKATLSVNRA